MLKSYISLSDDINKLTTILSRDSMEVRTPILSNEGLALHDCHRLQIYLAEEEPGFADPPFSPLKRERETRRASLVLRPASSGGPAPQTLFPPSVKVNLAVRRGITVPSRLPPAPPPRRRSQLPNESAHDVSEPGTSASLTPEEGLIQLQVRTQQPRATPGWDIDRASSMSED